MKCLRLAAIIEYISLIKQINEYCFNYYGIHYIHILSHVNHWGYLVFNLQSLYWYDVLCWVICQRKTGGLIIWRSGSLVVVYRGMAYKLDCVKSYGKQIEAHIRASGLSEDLVKDSSQSISVKHASRAAASSEADASNCSRNISNEEEMSLHELNCLLDELGPRFIDWSGREPLPVDADLLPDIVPGYKPPFRLLPHGTRQALKDREMTYLRRTARTLPPHFALGACNNIDLYFLIHTNIYYLY